MKYDIIAVVNSEENKEKLVLRLDTAIYDKKEINVFISNNSVFTRSINSCAAKGSAPYIVFLADGIYPKPDFLTKLDEYIATSPQEVVAFAMRHIPVETSTHYDPVNLETDIADVSALVIKRQSFETVGGFDEGLTCLYGVDLSWRLRANGGKLIYCPSAVAVDERIKDMRFEYTYGEYERLMLAYKYGSADVISRRKEKFKKTIESPRHFDGIRKELLKLYVRHFAQAGKFKKFRNVSPQIFRQSINVYDSGPDFSPQRGTHTLSELKTHPLVSIVVRTHKRKEVLRRTLMCLRNQIYKNFEVVIVEDGENTAEEMVKTDFSDLNINYYATGINVGRGRAGNIGIERARGEFVSFLDDDDYYYADFITAFLSEFEKNPQADFLISGGMAYKTNILSTDPYEFTVEEIYPILFDHITLMDMCVRCRIPMPCAMFRRHMYDLCGGMREDIGGDEDWAMWLKFMAKGKRANPYSCDIPRALSLFGYPADESAARKREEDYRVFDRIMLYDETLVFDVHGSEIRRWEEYVAADIAHLKNIGQLESFIAELKPLGIEKMEYSREGMNKITARQINNYYYWLVKHYSEQ